MCYFDNISLPSPHPPGINIAITGAIDQMNKNGLQIWILLKNPVHLVYRTSHLDNVKFCIAGYGGVFGVLWPN
jgi:hypothetical protein